MADKKKIGLDQVRKVAEEESLFLYQSVNSGQQRMRKAIRGLEARMLTILRKIEVNPNGRIEGAKVNLKQTQAIHREMLKAFEENYGAEARAVISDFDAVDRFIENSWTYLDEAPKYTGIDKNMNLGIRRTVEAQYSQFGENAKQSIDEALYAHMVGGKEYSSLVTAVQGVLTGHKDARGRPMEQYASQWAFDSVMNYHNQVNLSKAEELDINHFLYVGDIIGSSRKFCRRRAGKVYTRGQINSWDTHPWAGRSGPAFTHRGGYNCRHHWRPVRPEWLDGKTQVDIADWRVGASAIEAKPRFLEKTPGARGWNEFTEEERKHISRIERFLRQGKELTPKQRHMKFFQNSLNDAERAALVEALEKEGLQLPDILKKGVAKRPEKPPLVPSPKKVAKIPVKVKPKPAPPVPKPEEPKPAVGRSYKDLDKDEKKKAGSLRRRMIKGQPIKDGTVRVKWWHNLPEEDRINIIREWEKEGIVIDPVIRKGIGTPVAPTVVKPTPVPPPPKVDIPKAKSGSYSAIKKEIKDLEEKASSAGLIERTTARKRLSEAEKELAKIAPVAEVDKMRKKLIKEMMFRGDNTIERNIFEGTRHLPYSFLRDMRDANVKILYTEKGGASWNRESKVIKFSKYPRKGRSDFYRRPSTVAHEFGHALDYRMGARGGASFHSNAGYWHDDSPIPITTADGDRYREWYRSVQSGRIGRGSMGNGNTYQYHIGNFLDDYEGRIYSNGVGQEFWARNCERYSMGFSDASKNLRISKIDAEQFHKLIDKAKNSIDLDPDYISWMRVKKEAARAILKRISPDEYLRNYLKSGEATDWARQTKAYPEFADWSVDFFENYRNTERPLELEDFVDYDPDYYTDEYLKIVREIANIDLDKIF